MGPLGLGDFEGLWRIERRIRDLRAGTGGTLVGFATFRPEAGGLRCEERGRLSYGGGPSLEAARDYLWLPDSPGRIAVRFADGRPFHAFDLGPAAQADHWCDPDSYRVDYEFSGWPVWTMVWAVRGPRKDYVSESTFRRP